MAMTTVYARGEGGNLPHGVKTEIRVPRLVGVGAHSDRNQQGLHGRGCKVEEMAE